MRDINSKPVYRSLGRRPAYEPSTASTTSQAKKVTRSAYCKFTKTTRVIARSVYVSHNKDGGDTVRTSVIERTPARPISVGFVTAEERRVEAEERNAAWRLRTPVDQLAALDKRPGESKRQRARIAAAMTKKAHEASIPTKTAVNKKQTTDEKMGKKMAHLQGVVAAHPTTRPRSDKK